MLKFILLALVLLLVGCTTTVRPTLIPIPTNTPIVPTPIVIVEKVVEILYATPHTEIRECDTSVEAILYNDTVGFWCEPFPTPEPVETPEPLPVPTPIIVEVTVEVPIEVTVEVPVVETVEIPVTVEVIVTASPTATTTPVPTVTPTPTITPTPTATPIPPFIQIVSGNGTKLTGDYNFLERSIILDLEVKGTGEFTLNAITSNGCLVYLSTGTAPYTSRMFAEPQVPTGCNEFKQFGNGTKFSVAASSGVNWKLTLTQFGQPSRQTPPLTLTGQGQNILGPVLINALETISVHSDGETFFRVDIYEVFENEPIMAHVIDILGPVNGGWFLGVPYGTYMISIDTVGSRSWELSID